MRTLVAAYTRYGACIVVLVCLLAAMPASSDENNATIYMTGPNIKAVEAYNLGADLASQGKLQEALVETEKALALQPNFSLALTQKAGILNVMGKYQEALEATDAAIAGNAGIAEAWVNRADSLVHLGKYQEAIDAANRALAIDPSIEAANTTRLVATKLLESSAKAIPSPTLKAPFPVEPVLGALVIAGVLAFLRVSKKG